MAIVKILSVTTFYQDHISWRFRKKRPQVIIRQSDDGLREYICDGANLVVEIPQ